MENRNIFINSLSKNEIAILFKYRYEQYLNETKKQILFRMRDLEMEPEDVDGLVEEYKNIRFNDGIRRCLRCNSDKFFEQESEYSPSKSEASLLSNPFSSETIKVSNMVCSLCGFHDSSNRTFNDKEMLFVKKKQTVVALIIAAAIALLGGLVVFLNAL